jgi:hypothetical protein
MKKSILLLLTVFYLSTISFGQNSTVSNAKEWTWLGIDYTHCYFITSIDFVNADDLFEKTKAWNNLGYTEREKYIEKPLKSKKVVLSSNMINERNAEIDIEKRITDDESFYMHLDKDQVIKIVSEYNIPDDLSGIGLVLIAESYNKLEESGAYYVTFIDLDTKEVLCTERKLGKARGFSFRNYWAYTYYLVIKEIGKEYK